METKLGSIPPQYLLIEHGGAQRQWSCEHATRDGAIGQAREIANRNRCTVDVIGVRACLARQLDAQRAWYPIKRITPS